MAGFGFSMVVWQMLGQAKDDRYFSWRGFFWCVDICLPVAVGTEVTPRPPHRSVRAELPHTAPASGM